MKWMNDGTEELHGFWAAAAVYYESLYLSLEAELWCCDAFTYLSHPILS